LTRHSRSTASSTIATRAPARGDAPEGAEPLQRHCRAAKAAERLGDEGKAREYYRKLAALASEADTVRPELVIARKYAAN
jgi:hypothetical protein